MGEGLWICRYGGQKRNHGRPYLLDHGVLVRQVSLLNFTELLLSLKLELLGGLISAASKLPVKKSKKEN